MHASGTAGRGGLAVSGYAVSALIVALVAGCSRGPETGPRPAAPPSDAPALSSGTRVALCEALCDRGEACQAGDSTVSVSSPEPGDSNETADLIFPRRWIEGCERGCEDLKDPPTALEQRVAPCATLEECEGFHACVQAVFDPRQIDQTCADRCEALTACRGRPAPACRGRCEAGLSEIPDVTTGCYDAEDCLALERCAATWPPPDAATARTSLRVEGGAAIPSACVALCQRTVLCEAERLGLDPSERGPLLASMAEGLTNCQLDCAAHDALDADHREAIQGCADADTCQSFETCVKEI